MTTLSVERPSTEKRTPEETPAAIARTIAALACALTESFGAFINDDDDNGRDKLFQRLLERVEADHPTRGLLTTDREIETVERLKAAMPTDADLALFGQYVDHRDADVLIREDAVFLTGVAIGRHVQGPNPLMTV